MSIGWKLAHEIRRCCSAKPDREKGRTVIWLIQSCLFPLIKVQSQNKDSVKNAFNQHVPNLFAFVTTSIYVLPTPSTLMAQISEPETKLKPLTASSQFFLQQAVQSSGRYFTWDHHQPVSLCGASVQHKHLKMLWKYSAGTRELYQRPF